MPRRALLAAPVAVALLAACGGRGEAPPPQVACGSTASGGTLAVGDLPTCGSVGGLGANTYSFTTGAPGQYTVTLWTTFGDADLYVYLGSGPSRALVGSSFNTPPVWIDAVVVPAAAAATLYTVDVADANYALTGSSYAVQVTSP